MKYLGCKVGSYLGFLLIWTSPNIPLKSFMYLSSSTSGSITYFPFKIQDLALKSLFDMFKQGFRKTNRLFCLAIALGELFNKQSIV